MRTLNEIVLTLLMSQPDQWFTGTYIRHWIYHNSIGGLKVSEVELRDLIKKLRFGGHTIIAGAKGYSYTHNLTKLREYITNRKLELESELNILRKMEGKW